MEEIERLSVRSIRRPYRSADIPLNSVSVLFSDQRRLIIVPAMRYGNIIDRIQRIWIEKKIGQKTFKLASIDFQDAKPIPDPKSDKEILSRIPVYVQIVADDLRRWMEAPDIEFTAEVIEKLASIYQAA